MNQQNQPSMVKQLDLLNSNLTDSEIQFISQEEDSEFDDDYEELLEEEEEEEEDADFGEGDEDQDLDDDEFYSEGDSEDEDSFEEDLDESEDEFEEDLEGDEEDEEEIEEEDESEDSEEESELAKAQQQRLEAMERELQRLRETRDKEPVDPKKAQEFLSKPFSYSLPEKIEETDRFSNKAKAWIASDPDAAAFMVELANDLLSQRQGWEVEYQKANQTIEDYKNQQALRLKSYLNDRGVDPSFMQDERYRKMLQESPEFLNKLKQEIEDYGESDPLIYIKAHDQFKNYLAKQGEKPARKKRSKASKRSKAEQSIRKKSGSNTPKPTRKKKDDDFLSRYNKRT